MPAAALSPSESTPAEAVRLPAKVFRRPRTNVPCPALVRPAVPTTAPAKVTTDCGLATVKVRVDAPRSTVPSSKKP